MTFTPLAAWILTFLIHSTVLTGLAWLCVRWVGGPAGKALVLRGALLGAFLTATLVGFMGSGQEMVLPEITHGGPILSVTASAQPMAMDFAPAASVGTAPTTPAPAPLVGSASLGNLAWTWIPVSLFLLSLIGVLRLILEERAAWRLLGKRKRIVDPTITKVARSMAGAKGLNRRLRLTQSARTHSPMAIGRREIVLPEKAMAELDPAQLEALLAHEMGHLVRRDPFWLGACRMAVALAWFQPLLRWTLSRLEEETELAADDWAAQRVGNGVDLALCLERVGTWLTESPAPASAAAMASSGSVLVSRVERLLTEGKRESRRSLFAISGSVAIALGLFACVGPSVTSGENGQNSHETSESGEASKAKDSEPGGVALFAVVDDGGSDPRSSNLHQISIYIRVSKPGRTVSYRTAGGVHATPDELEQWLKSQRNAASDQGVHLHPESGTQYKDIIPVLDAVIASGYTDVRFSGVNVETENEWSERYSIDSGARDPHDPILAKAYPYLKLGIRLNGKGELTSFRTWGKKSLGIPQEDPRVDMLNKIHEAEAMSIPAVLAVPMDELLIRVEADTPFSHVQKIMEKCASQEIQMPNIHVRLNADPDYLTDVSLPTDQAIITEEVEEGESPKMDSTIPTSALRREIRARKAKDGTVLFTLLGEGIYVPGRTAKETNAWGTSVVINCDPDVPMGELLPHLNGLSTLGVRLTFTASMSQGR